MTIRRMRVLMSVALVGLLAVGLWLTFYTPSALQRPKWKTPDGYEITLEHVSFGKMHRFRQSNWKQSLVRAVPFLARVMPPNSGGSFGLANETLGIWISIWDGQSGKYISPPYPTYLEVADEHGCTSQATSGMSTYAEGKPLNCFPLEVFPRGEKRILARLYRKNPKELLASMVVENPVLAKPANWVIDATPSKSNGALDVRFLGWKDSSPQFEILEGGKVVTNYFFEGTEFRDRWGNTSRSLCRLEPVWEVSAWFYKKLSEEFPAESVLHLGPFPFPTNGTFTPLNLNATIKGSQVAVLGFGGSGRHVFSNGLHFATSPLAPGQRDSGVSSSSWTLNGAQISTSEKTCDKPVLIFRQGGLGKNDKTFVRALTQDGRIVRGEFAGSANHIAFYEFPDLNTNSTTIKVDILVQPGLGFHFYVKPPPPKATK